MNSPVRAGTPLTKVVSRRRPQALAGQQLTGEGDRVAWLSRAASGRFPHVVRGIGDDAAILRVPDGEELAVTTDLYLEDVHFRRDWHSAKSCGHRCLARGLSDLAAMGAQPLAAFLSAALPDDLAGEWADEFFAGVLSLARRSNVPLAGGDLARSPSGFVADITLVGSVPAGKALLRSGARPGDSIYVTGELGGTAAALDALRDGGKLTPRLRKRAMSPEPRIAAGIALRRLGATACMDLSDGLSLDLARLVGASGVRAEIDAASLPIFRGATLEHALHGGEDYELLFTARKTTRLPKTIGGAAVYRIGTVLPPLQRAPAVLLRDGKAVTTLEPRGWQYTWPARPAE